MEFGACAACNSGTRGADAVASIISRLHPDNGEGSWQNDEIKKRVPALDAFAPGVREEISLCGRHERRWMRRAGFGL